MDAIVYREDVAILHELLPQGAEVPQHSVDYTVFIVLLKGAVEVRIGSQDWHAYRAGTVLEVPHGVPAGVRNQHPETAEFFVIKAGGKPRRNKRTSCRPC